MRPRRPAPILANAATTECRPTAHGLSPKTTRLILNEPEAFVSRKATAWGRIVGATGTGALDKQRFVSALEAEKKRTSAVEVLLSQVALKYGATRSAFAFFFCLDFLDGLPGCATQICVLRFRCLTKRRHEKVSSWPATA